ncbi:hypothetical protein BDN70DRAFT_598634 [Pholiota conissans]|uniref:Uncharacterized protein n=1 Tax=Pholiota conissans TaxID=109636 RepID=A0A9P5Z785_9AGAR|nr:hypothetical protein BDN70DRAFT_598634 [Pholiota conissans]
MEQSGITDKKRSFEHDEDMDDEEHEAKAKKTRLQNEAEDQLMDDEDAPRHRGSKRGAVDEYEDEDEEGGPIASGSRGKRARKVSKADSSMDVDAYDEEADDVPDLRHIESVRGKKRDRAEAGSTFGGDDEDEEAGSAGEFENDKARRRRKRRTVGRKSDVPSSARGKKRDRSDEFSGNEFSGESSPERRASASRNRKKGKRGSLLPGQAQALRRERRQGEEEGGSDISMDGSVSTSVRMNGRNVGDEWESNGIKYKVGPNFQRLRLALVKKATQKYPMPKDSQHPDRDANLQVCVEKWLTEEEYQDAKAKHMLAWQDETPSPTPAPPEKLTLDILSAQQDSVPFPSVNPTGKNLLWGSSTTTTPTMSPAPPSPPSTGVQIPAVNAGYSTPIHGGRLGRHSIATSGLPASPFNVSQVPTAKRIASTSRALNLAASVSGSPGDLITNEEVPSSPGLYDSTNASGPGTLRSLKVWSKWEKQEHEARAMMKIREANRKKAGEGEMGEGG